MDAMVITDFGDTDVFEHRDADRPEPGPTELLVRVHASSVNPVDCKIRQAGSWAGISPPTIIGYDVSGVVEETGKAVTDFTVGDEVFYTSEIFGEQGSYAEFHTVDESIVAPKPGSLSHEEAAALPLAAATAWEAIVTRGAVTAGETVLIHGAGGVGSHAVQIADASGATVIAVTSPETVDQTEELGAARAIDYESDSFVDVIESEFDKGVDLVFDTVGGETLVGSTEITNPHGRLVTILEPEGEWGTAYQQNYTLEMLFLERDRRPLDALRRLVEAKRLEPVLDSVLPLADVAQAHELVEGGGLTGKVVLDVDGA
ncbi:alcohol dehydrogenase zinc-binding domain-containing protein [Natrialba hulunbeirensis JCM 10989]|uniref:Alcohol dehydrogenase zinc-binding domain-containing protein n=1 Tax=Natrialba hulunbeirensis JCM 10989 TaxID=1227493 RepID=L9ZSU1_9EURY|nr:zinc-binding dehydrogenase [Natrialba hulunbeirensis]ELY89510.1 alcohol dehydrogenase zinc-binding domain-containing protein [Natrialba hulunbeirensis JCM 10989]